MAEIADYQSAATSTSAAVTAVTSADQQASQTQPILVQTGNTSQAQVGSVISFSNLLKPFALCTI